MRLINQTSNMLVADEVFCANTFLARSIGLLNRKIFLPRQALILEPCNAVHSIFMRFAIDLLFVDKNNQVIALLVDFKPNRLTRIYGRARKVIELPVGTVQLTQTKVSDQLQLLS